MCGRLDKISGLLSVCMLWIFTCESHICSNSLASLSDLIFRWCKTVDLSFLSSFLKQLKKTAFVTFVLQPNRSEYRQRGVTFRVARAQLLLGITKTSSALPSALVRESEVCLWCAAVALPGIERENKIHRNVIWWLVWIIVIQSLLLYDLSRYF